MSEPFPGDFPGTIGVPPDVQQLAAASDLVCVGEVADHSEQGEVQHTIGSEEHTFERVAATVRVEQTLRGDAPGDTIEVEWLRLDLPSALARLEPGERAVLFLTRDGDRYRLADVANGKQPVTPELLAQLES
jgi:hypothetical protein